jgi:hypothetical protein
MQRLRLVHLFRRAVQNLRGRRRIFLHAAGDDPQRPVRQRPLQGQGFVRRAFIQVSTSSGVVRITGIAFGWMAPTSAFGSVVRNA